MGAIPHQHHETEGDSFLVQWCGQLIELVTPPETKVQKLSRIIKGLLRSTKEG